MFYFIVDSILKKVQIKLYIDASWILRIEI